MSYFTIAVAGAVGNVLVGVFGSSPVNAVLGMLLLGACYTLAYTEHRAELRARGDEL